MGTGVQWLSRAELERRAGYAFARGERYFREGRVRQLEVSERQISARVLGTQIADYAVSLWREKNRIIGECECPMGAGFCKHQVAVALAAEDPFPAEPEVPFPRLTDLRVQLEKLQLLSFFYRSAAEAQAFASGEEFLFLQHALSVEPLHTLVTAEGPSPSLASRLGKKLPQVREAAVKRLEQLKAHAGAGREEEPARGTCPLVEVPSWWAPLLALRTRVRAGCAPLPASELKDGFTADPARCGWRWRPKNQVLRRRYEPPVSPTVTVEFKGLEPSVHCTCEVPISGGCPHKLEAIDAFLVRLADPAQRPQMEELVSELSRPAWARVLSALDALEKAPPKERAPSVVQVTWTLSLYNRMSVDALVSRQLKNGSMSDLKPLGLRSMLDKYRDELDDLDKRVARVALELEHGGSSHGPEHAELLELLSGHPRVTSDDGKTPLKIFRGPLELRVAREGELLRLQAGCGDLTVPAADALQSQVGGDGKHALLFALDRHQAAVATVTPQLRATLEVLEREGDLFPPESEGDLLDRLTRLSSRMKVAHGDGVLGDEVSAQPSWSLVLGMVDGELHGRLLVRPLPGAPAFVPAEGPREVPGASRGRRVFVRRDFATERMRAQALFADLPLRASRSEGPFAFAFEDPQAALALVSQLRDACPEGLSIEWEDTELQVLSLRSATALRVEVDRRQDWFGLAGFAEASGHRVELALLLDAARRDVRFAQVSENRWVELDAALRAQLAAVADHAFVQKREVELSPGAVSALDALEEAGAALEADAAWRQMSERLRDSLKVRPKVPATLKAELRDYQEEGFRWASRLSRWAEGACLADDMGLGKTVQALALLLERAKLGPAIVLAPTSVCFNWVDEAKKFAPKLRIVLLGEGDRERAVKGLGKGDVLVVSYGLLPREVEALAQIPFATLILDEAQAVKNASTQRAKAARALKAEFKLALSGTPLENNLAELWSLFRVVFPSLLGSWERFRERFASPIERGRDPQAMAALSRVLRPFLLRRTKGEVARELPARTEMEVPVVLSDAERALYDDARLAAIAELKDMAGKLPDAQRRIQVLAALTRLRLLASHPKLYEASSAVASSKMQRLVELVEQLKSEGHRALVFSQFTSHLALVRESLDAADIGYQLLQGDTPPKERARRVKAFQDGEGDVFLISLKAGGTGLNLTGADYVIHLDPWWNPAVEDQATDRAHRIGQTKPVTVYRLVSRGTIEEKILALHADKRALVSDVLEGTGAAAKLSTRELIDLLNSQE